MDKRARRVEADIDYLDGATVDGRRCAQLKRNATRPGELTDHLTIDIVNTAQAFVNVRGRAEYVVAVAATINENRVGGKASLAEVDEAIAQLVAYRERIYPSEEAAA